MAGTPSAAPMSNDVLSGRLIAWMLGTIANSAAVPPRWNARSNCSDEPAAIRVRHYPRCRHRLSGPARPVLSVVRVRARANDPHADLADPGHKLIEVTVDQHLG